MSNKRAPISVLDETLAKLTEVDCYKSAYFQQDLSDYGSFQIQINWNILDAAGFRYAEYFTLGRFVLFGTDMDKCGQILEVEKKIDEGGKGSQIVTVKGKQAKVIFSQRVVEPPAGSANYTQTAVAETVMRTVVQAQMGTTAAASRQVSILNVGASAGLGASYTYSSRYKLLSEDLKTISQSTGLGFNLQLDLSAKKLNFVVIPGVNRVASQSVNPRVIISTDFDTLKTGSIKDSYVAYKNLVIAAGQGVGENRNVRKVYSGTEPTGLARRESFADMRDLANTTDIDARGASVIQEKSVQKFVDAEALSYSQYVLGTDYNIGDFITVSAYGESQDVQITSIKESWAPNSYDIGMSFNRAYPEAPKVQSAEYQATAQALNNSEPYGNNKITVIDTTVHSQFNCNTTVIINKGTTTVQTISTNNAATSGIVVTLINVGAGDAIIVDGNSLTGDYPLLKQGIAAKFVWTGAFWEYLTPVSGSNSNGNWIKYPDGTMEQWGRHAVTASLGSYAISFPLSFNDINYSMTFGAENGSTPSDIYIFCYNRSVSGITDYLRGAGWTTQTNFVNWHAIGKWK